MEKWGGTQSSPCPRDPRVHARASRREPGRRASGSLTEPDPPGRCGTPGTGAREGVRSPPASRAKRGAEGRRPRPAHGVTAVTPKGTESSQASVRAPRCTARPAALGEGCPGGRGPGDVQPKGVTSAARHLETVGQEVAGERTGPRLVRRAGQAASLLPTPCTRTQLRGQPTISMGTIISLIWVNSSFAEPAGRRGQHGGIHACFLSCSSKPTRFKYGEEGFHVHQHLLEKGPKLLRPEQL